MMVVHAKPNTHPGGVQGTLFKAKYQLEVTPGPVKRPPIPRVIKLSIKKTISPVINVDLVGFIMAQKYGVADNSLKVTLVCLKQDLDNW